VGGYIGEMLGGQTVPEAGGVGDGVYGYGRLRGDLILFRSQTSDTVGFDLRESAVLIEAVSWKTVAWLCRDSTGAGGEWEY